MSKKQKNTEAVPVDEVVKIVNARLEDWQSWAKGAAYAHVLKPSEFLALVVWALESRKGDALTDVEMHKAIGDWVHVINKGLEMKRLRPLHGISLLPVHDAMESEWVVAVSDLNNLMGMVPWSFDVEWALAEFRKGANDSEEKISTWEAAADFHKKQRGKDGKGKPSWIHAKLAPIAAAIASGVKVDAIAKRAGIARQTLRGVLDGYKENPQKYGAPVVAAIKPAAHVPAGADAMRGVWAAPKAA